MDNHYHLLIETPEGNLSQGRIYHSHLGYGYTLKEIARHLGIHYTAASKAVKRIGEGK